MNVPEPELVPMNECAWLIRFHAGIDVLVNRAVHSLANTLERQFRFKPLEILPCYDSLLLSFPAKTAIDKHGLLQDEIQQFLDSWYRQYLPLEDAAESPLVEIPVCYDTELGNDLQFISRAKGLALEEVIAAHNSVTYQVYFMGFQPGFAYMGKVDERIQMPRKEAPVPVKAGAVGIAGLQTGIYPFHAPGGWHIVGYTPLAVFDINRQQPSLFMPGIQVRFSPVNLQAYQKLSSS